MSLERSDVGGWLNGPPVDESSWPGKRLGLPQNGSGSVASLGRRALGLLIDWIACSVIAQVFWQDSTTAPLIVFIVEQVLLVGLFGTSLGHRAVGVHVAAAPSSSVLTRQPFFVRAAVRSLLLSLFIPAAVMDTDLRGLNDRAAGLIVLRR
ncbi:RDD family protein [Falsarthrobacter nasiphocae]|uniref:RDD family membrane protein YckC n=1 Tax=Falsarthrobacter nasiphocae TaxID=189863 RepID=A0AAE4C5P4_9MICC|nr:RDD family protein [Falsarthrobacter nasiphocae]MDR6891292.1 putative RDD family membrane protein YckC [Falsarthrobacter nasiphocae]